LLVSASALAQSPEVPGQHNEVPEGTTEDAHQIHAEAYAEDRGVDIDEAKRRLELQAAVMDLSAQLMTHERDVMANIRIEHEPNFHVIIFVIPGGKERVIPYLKDGPLADITTFEMVEYTQDQLVADLERANELLRPLEVLYSAVVTEREVQIFVEDAEALQKRLNEEKIELPATVKVHEVEILGPETDGTVIGGFAVSTPGNCTNSSTWSICWTRNAGCIVSFPCEMAQPQSSPKRGEERRLDDQKAPIDHIDHIAQVRGIRCD